ncbi:MAG: SDR family oxidoreductase [Anaerolineae bacterium]|jgi:NAD(P)-dependent dehydrogenase (short-subunit alcohol dehydrogenase family)|nr:SDR family oxidoreductase [Anaerolineae bacterium]
MAALAGKVAVVAGATRGAGRGIARALGEAGATVYCTGRSVRGAPSDKNRSETIDETAELVTAAGGRGIAVRVDHTEREQVRLLFERVAAEQGRLDILVNDLTGDGYAEAWGTPFAERSLDLGLKLLRTGVETHIINAYYALPLLIKTGGGLIIEMTDGIDVREVRAGAFYYSLEKSFVIRLALGLAEELREHNIAVVALSPGFMRSEEVLDHFGVREENWRDAVAQDRHFGYSETPLYVGRAVVALATDGEVMKKSGQALLSGRLAREYGFTDADGTQPVWLY